MDLPNTSNYSLTVRVLIRIQQNDFHGNFSDYFRIIHSLLLAQLGDTREGLKCAR